MCDTLVALENSTKDGSVIFGKNSDRPNAEVQLITYNPRTTYSKDEELKCTYITVPQVRETVSVILSQPWWMWGAEMGCNEYGVVIGNEAVHSFEPERKKGLLGMDLLRLGLERAKTANESLNVITKLLERYHQGGGCAYGDPNWKYHNSFIIADPQEAYVLETADDWWIAEIVKDVRSISNGLTIRGKGDLRREGIIQYAIQKGYCKDDNEFDFAVTFSGSGSSTSPHSRKGRTTQLLNQNKGEITKRLMMEFLRDHKAGVCMHGWFESTGSQVSVLREDFIDTHWFTGTTLPCMSIFKPHIFPIGDQKVLDPAPYPEINPNWNWCKDKDSKLRKNTKRMREIEENIIEELKDALSDQSLRENPDDLKNEIYELNNLAWTKTKQFF